MTALTTRLSAAVSAFKSPPHKSYYPITSGERWVYGGLSRQARLYDSSRFNIALAYLLLEPVRKCIDTYASVVTRIPYRIMHNTTHDPANDEEIAASTDVGKARHDAVEIFRNHRRRYHIAFMQALMYEHMLYDMMLTELIPSQRSINRVPSQRVIGGVRVLRGMAVSLQGNYATGEIDHFWYSGDGGKTRFDPDEVAYDRGYNPQDDYEGSSLVESVLSELNIMEAFQHYVQRMLKKADRPDVYAAFAEQMNATPQNQKALEDELERYKNDPRKTIFVGSLPLSFAAIPNNDLNNQLGIDEPTRKAIYRAFGVPLAMAGDTTETGYKEGDEVYAAWVKNDVMPRLVNIRDYVNDSILPAIGLDETHRIEFDTSEFDIVTERDRIRSEVIEIDVRSGLLSIGQARKERGYDDAPEFDDLYMLEGVPVPKTELLNLWRYKYQAQAMLDTAQAVEARATADAKETEAQQSPEPAPRLQLTDGHEVGVETWDYTRDKAFDELKAWQKFTKADKSRRFEPAYLRGDLADGIQAALDSVDDPRSAFDEAFAAFRHHDIDAIEAAFVDALAGNTKSLNTLETDFKLRFNPVVQAIRDKEIDNRRRAGNLLRQLLRTFIPRAYIEGLRAAGVFDEPDADEEDDIKSLIQEQSQYVSSFTDNLINKEGITDEQYKQKAGQWFRKSIKPAYYAGLESAKANQMMEFVGDDGLESCKTCTRLKGQRHRMKDWGRKELRPQVDTGNFECGGFECEHDLEPVAAKARGRW